VAEWIAVIHPRQVNSALSPLTYAESKRVYVGGLTLAKADRHWAEFTFTNPESGVRMLTWIGLNKD